MANQINTTTFSRFHNMSPGMFADLIGELDRKAKSATAELEAAKDAFKANGFLIAQGAVFSVMVQKSIRQNLDTAKVKADMGQSWFDDHARLSEVISLRISATAEAVAA